MYKISLLFCESQQLNRTRCQSWPVQLAACLHFTGVALLEVLNNSPFICTQPSQLHFHYKRIKIEITSAPQQAHMAVFPQEIGAPFEMQCGRNIWNLRLCSYTQEKKDHVGSTPLCHTHMEIAVGEEPQGCPGFPGPPHGSKLRNQLQAISPTCTLVSFTGHSDDLQKTQGIDTLPFNCTWS